jgi:cellulose synthase/poly-beta-1,6-N-acetylglucosamine synthase-like glycosyltransferase
MLAAAVLAVSIVLFSVASATLWWMMSAWRTPEMLASTTFPEPDGKSELSFSLMLPARHEQGVLEHTVQRMLESTHSNYEIIIITGHDDPETTQIADKLAELAPDRVRVVIDTHEIKGKAKALNTALPLCRGAIVGVFDAEDIVHPDLLLHVDYAFRSERADVVQGGVQLINFQSSWYSLRNCLEYFFWFRSRLHLQAQKGFITLGGNTVFIRTNLLRQINGWDPNCLAEDCDLGVTVSSGGGKVVVAYDSQMVTREETPDTVMSLFKQRTRWNQGFFQVYRKGIWKQLPTARQRFLARFTLGTPFFQALSGLAVPIGIAIGVFVSVPIEIAMISWLPAVPAFLVLAFEIAALRDFGKEYALNVRFIDYVKLIIGTPFYQILLMGAAIRAVWRESTGRKDWELTRHVGAHLAAPAPTSATTSV